MKIAIIGAGLIGRKRALNLPIGVELVCVCDVDENKGKAMATEFNCEYVSDWDKVVKSSEIEAVFVATTHNWLTPIATEAIRNRKHVFSETPGAINSEEFNKIIDIHKLNQVTVMFGYNHRYHLAIQKAKEIIDSGEFGEVMFVRAKYGHGARLGYEKEWRFDEKMSGGGELIDQGPHLIDLVNYLAGKMDDVAGFTGTMFWDTKLEDSAFWVMKNDKGQLAQLSVTCVEWKNIFSFEIMLKKAKIQIDGLGRSYGREKLTLYKMKPEMGPPDVEDFEFPDEDISWKKENEVFFNLIADENRSDKLILDAKYVLDVVNKLYLLNKKT